MAGQRASEAEIRAVERETSGGPTDIVVDITGCARCLTDHANLLFKPLGHPIEMDRARPITHWALCPSNGQPVLMAIGTRGPVGENVTPSGHLE